jgi:hypothetical protein
MKVELPSGPGYSGIFVRGLRSAGDTNAVEEAGAVIVRRTYSVAGGALTPDAGGETVVMADTINVIGSTPWVVVENDLAVSKRFGDVIVLGGKAAGRGGAVTLDGTVKLRRSAADFPDFDLQTNLFGWHPRSDPARLDDARMTTGQPSAASDRYDRLLFGVRRAEDPIAIAFPSALPAHAAVKVTQTRIAPETEDPVLMSFNYAMPALSLTLFVHEGRGPDRDTRWCPHPAGTMVFDTLIVRPATGKAAALWRKSWPWGAPGADTLRRAVVSEGSA